MKNKKILLPRFLNNRYNIWKSTHYLQNEKNIKKLAKRGQKPQAMIISCCDSRVNVTSIFGAQEGDLFIHRNIANIIPPYKSNKTDQSTLAAIEYALKELKVPKGEISYNSLILIVPIFLNFGAGLFVRSIGTNAKDNKTETKIKGSYAIGSLIFNKSIPKANPKNITIM